MNFWHSFPLKSETQIEINSGKFKLKNQKNYKHNQKKGPTALKYEPQETTVLSILPQHANE